MDIVPSLYKIFNYSKVMKHVTYKHNDSASLTHSFDTQISENMNKSETYYRLQNLEMKHYEMF